MNSSEITLRNIKEITNKMNKKEFNKVWNLLQSDEDCTTLLNKYNNLELNNLKNHFKNIKKQAQVQEPNWNNLKKRVERESFKQDNLISIKTFTKYAAVIISFITIGFVLFSLLTNDLNEARKNLTKTIIKPGAKSAILILANGKSIDLSKNKGVDLVKNKNYSISNTKNDLLAYDSKSTISKKIEYNTVFVPKAGEYTIQLSDSTIVYLNSESELKYPINFIGKERRVFLKGEAYFNVAKNKNKSFIVELNDMSVEVLGTSFNVNSYFENSEIKTTLVEGKVKVYENNNQSNFVIIKPNEQVSFSKGNLKVKKVDVEEYISWKNGKFYFDDLCLEKVIIQIERWYNIEVKYKSEKIKKIEFTGVIDKSKSANHIFNIIEQVTNVMFYKRGKYIYVDKK